MGNKEIQKEWDEIPHNGILPNEVKSRMWMKIRSETLDRRKRNYKWIAAACAILFISLIGYHSFTNSGFEKVEVIATNTYPDDVRLLRLPDGTRVWVNQNTHIEYAKEFIGNERKVTLNGEAFFEVAKDPSKPFVITSGDVTTTVLGTSFNVKAYLGKPAEIRVRTGKVKVEGNQNTVFLEKGYAAIALADNKIMQKQKILVLEPEWKKSLLDIDGLTLEQVIDRLSLDHTLSVEYNSEDLKGLKIKGTLDTRQGVGDMLETIAFALNLTISTKSGNTYAISR